MGNLNSVKKMLNRLKVESVVSSDAQDIADARKIILPGVGHFGRAMSNLKELKLLDALNEAVLGKRKPTLGICLGMQLFARRSAEGDSAGLNWLAAEAVKFEVSDRRKYKVPHLGWNRVKTRKDSRLMEGIADAAEFYFVHSYHVALENPADELGETVYERAFSSALEKDNIFGVQFHPEKSHDAGARLLRNFIEL